MSPEEAWPVYRQHGGGVLLWYHGWIERADLCPLRPLNLGLHNSDGQPEALGDGPSQEITLALLPFCPAVGAGTESLDDKGTSVSEGFVYCPSRVFFAFLTPYGLIYLCVFFCALWSVPLHGHTLKWG